jgi:glycosyltransferase involved in cell wall biosynthesis
MDNKHAQKKVVMTVVNEFTTDYRVHREAKALVDAGYDVTIFCVWKKGLAREQELEGIHVRRILDGYIRLPVSASARRIRAVWKKHLMEAPADIYHAHDRDALDMTSRVARKKGVPFIYDSHEFWPDKNQYENNTGSLRDRLSNWWWTAKERHHARKANAIIMTSPGHAAGLVALFKVQRPVLVRNIPEFQRGTNRRALHQELGLPDDAKIIVYVGNIQKKRGLEQVLDALPELPKNVHFVTIGYGPYAEEFKKRVPEELRQRVHVHPPIPYREIVPLIHSADIGVAPFQANCFSHRHVLPNKPFEYMMAELPIAASDFPEMGQIIRDAHYGRVFNPGNPADIARVLNEMLSDPDQLAAYRKNAEHASRTKYRWDIEKNSLLNLYKKILG